MKFNIIARRRERRMKKAAERRAAVDRWNAQSPELRRRLAESASQYMEHARNKVLDEGTTMARWLTASLLAINGAGALATLNAADKLLYPGLTGALFIAGLLLAMTSGWLLQVFNYSSADLLAQRTIQWIIVSERGYRDGDDEGQIDMADDRHGFWAGSAPISGWLSAFFFIGACVALACSLPAASKVSQHISGSPAKNEPARSCTGRLESDRSYKPRDVSLGRDMGQCL